MKNSLAGLRLWLVKTEDKEGYENGGVLLVLTQEHDVAAAVRKAQAFLNNEKQGRRIRSISNEGTIDS